MSDEKTSPLTGMTVILKNGMNAKVTSSRPLGDYEFAGIDGNGMRLYFSLNDIVSIFPEKKTKA